MQLTRRRLAALSAALTGTILAASLGIARSDDARESESPARFTTAGELIRPEGYREWVYVGTPHTPNDLNNGAAPFPEFHNVYIDPGSWAHYTKTGEFPEGTMLAKELVSVGSTQAVSGNGYFMGDFVGLEIALKSAERYSDEPGNWAYFSFGHEYPLADSATAFPSQACNACHEGTAADDFVFTQYYPHLRAAKGSKARSVAWNGPELDGDGQLFRPEGYREWVYVGTPLTPNDLNNGAAPFPEFHSVYIDRGSWDHYKRTGEFAEGTTIVKELIQVGSKQAVSGNGYFMGDFIGLEVTIKSAEHFPDEPGNWAYFSFGHEYPLTNTAPAFDALACNACHDANAAEDFVFTQYYPVLPAAKPGKTAKASHDGANCADCADGLRKLAKTTADAKESDGGTPTGTVGSIPLGKEELFGFLQSGAYREFPGQESTTHPSAGPHSIEGTFGLPVRTFLNQTMLESLSAGNNTHPMGAGIVKEMFSRSGELQGFAVSVKTQNDSAGGSGWFWYEVTSVTDSDALVANGNGVALCFGCHSTGNDFVLTKFPLK